MQRRLLLDVVVGQGAAVLQLLAGEDQTLLVGRDACRATVTQQSKEADDTACVTLPSTQGTMMRLQRKERLKCVD